MSERRTMIHAEHPLPVSRRCALLDVARSTVYYRPKPVADGDLRLVRLIDEIHLELPFYGTRRLPREFWRVEAYPPTRVSDGDSALTLAVSLK